MKNVLVIYYSQSGQLESIAQNIAKPFLNSEEIKVTFHEIQLEKPFPFPWDKTSFFDAGILFEKVGKIGTDKDCLIRNEINSGKTDGVHPTPNGYRFLALAISQFIQYNQLPATRIVCFGDSITRGDGSVDQESYPAYLKKLLS